MNMSLQYLWPVGNVCSSECISSNVSTVSENGSAFAVTTGLDHSKCEGCVAWGGTGQLNPLVAAGLSLVSFSGAEYCYSGFWILCGVKGGIFLIIMCPTILLRCGKRQQDIVEARESFMYKGRLKVALTIFLITLVLIILAWDTLNFMAILNLFRNESWRFRGEACGKPFLNSSELFASLKDHSVRPWLIHKGNDCNGTLLD